MGRAMTGPLIEKAKHFHELMELKEPCEFSIGWLQRFKKRHALGN